MNVLIVGGGALGQVFGLGLTRGGATVSYLVKPAQAEQARAGFHLYRMRRFQRPTVHYLRPNAILIDPGEAGGQEWDVVFLCVQSTALRDEWLGGLRDQIGAATVVTIGQDVRDRDVLRLYWPTEQIVQILPSLLAYHAPLADEPVPVPGTAYWLPPGSSLAISGDNVRVQPLVAALKQGGLRSKDVGGVSPGNMTAALTMPYIAALEAAGWSLQSLQTRLRLAAGAAREATAVVAILDGIRPPSRLATLPLVACLAFALLPCLVPFELERYLQVHFVKVGGQTRQMLDGWITAAHSHGLAPKRMEELRRVLPPL